jgi:threonine synthase
MLELWHGPTAAFKDMALQLLPHLLTLSAKKYAGGKQIAILTATSGDTGKAALEGFKDVPGTRILVFYPKDGVSEVQRLQMTTQEGANVGVCGVNGNFDDAQAAVKQIFTDKALAGRLAEKDLMFSSANSINWGRLVPQVCYYVSAYCDLLSEGEIQPGETINVCVPTGNFGNILAAYYAKNMGLPIGKLICASNVNNVLTDFIQTGTYDRRREFVQTTSPSMDILISSNLERLLFALTGEDDKAVASMMGQLAEQGFYSVGGETASVLAEGFYAAFCDEANTAATIKATFEGYGYLCDTHTAVGLYAAQKYVSETGDKTKVLVASTASPFKFPASILRAITGEESKLDEFAQAEKLAALTGTAPPESITGLKAKPVRFSEWRERGSLKDYVVEQLNM